jgi:tripartite ATP-independent transporter DctP family solute receptor
MMRKTSFVALGAVAALGLAACSGGGQTADPAAGGDSYTIQFAHVVSAETTQHQAYELFAERVAEQSDGRITVEIFPDGQLGGEREMLESVQAGNLQMTSPSVGVVANFDESLQVFDYPFIFEDAQTAYEVLDGEVGTELLAGLEDSGIHALGYGENGFRHLATAGDVVTSPEQMSGVKLRTMEVPMHIAYWQSIGANPTPMPFTEVFTALQQGVADGVENPLQLIYTGKFHEPAPNITTTGHIYDPEIVIINQAFFESLSAEDQEIIQSSMDEAIAELRSLNADLDGELRELLISEGSTITDLSAEERQAWIDSAIPFYEENADKVDTETLIALLEAAGNTTYLEAIQ